MAATLTIASVSLLAGWCDRNHDVHLDEDPDNTITSTGEKPEVLEAGTDHTLITG